MKALKSDTCARTNVTDWLILKPVVDRKENTALKMTDKIDPPHYKTGLVECIEAIESSLSPEEFKGYLKASIIKYLWRYEQKNGLEDLQKADWFLRKLMYHVEKDEGQGTKDIMWKKRIN